MVVSIIVNSAPLTATEASACEGIDTPEKRVEFVQTVGRELYGYLKRGENDVLALQRWFQAGGRSSGAPCGVRSVRNLCSALESSIPSMVRDYRFALAISFRAENRGYDYSKLQKIGNPWLRPPPFLPDRSSAFAPLSETERNEIEDELVALWDSRADLSLGDLEALEWLAPRGLIEKFIEDSEKLATDPQRSRWSGSRQLPLAIIAKLKETRALPTAKSRVEAAMRIDDERWNRFKETIASRINQLAGLKVWVLVDTFRPLVYLKSQNPSLEDILSAFESTLKDNRSVQSELRAQVTTLNQLMTKVTSMGGLSHANSEQESELKDIEYWFVERVSFASEVLSRYPQLCRAGDGLIRSFARDSQVDLAVSALLLMAPTLRLIPGLPVGSRLLVFLSALGAAKISLQDISHYMQIRRDFTARWIPEGRFSLLTDTQAMQDALETANVAPFLFLVTLGVPSASASKTATSFK